MNLLEKLAGVWITPNRSFAGMILGLYLSTEDWKGLYAANQYWHQRLQERCPLCRTPLHPKKKKAFLYEIQNIRTDLRLPKSPCGNPTCHKKTDKKHTRILGYLKNTKTPRYSLRLFCPTYQEKTEKYFIRRLRDAEEAWSDKVEIMKLMPRSTWWEYSGSF